MKQETAEIIGIKVLTWLISKDELFPVFMGSTGISEQELRERLAAQETELFSAVLDFVTMDDAWVQSCAEDTGLAPEDPMRARQALPGGAEINWT
ncbi:DUF3572 domain-containing protein [Celeribacter litoreus]|uniref:DUF3572 domain-containing protein n=1 Tax=Celeribacter litoreus TaxID=2876714 RepID=UPI001CCE95FC|nr:DUF3572 domain-containing protein [Celeribacter litoreus]MCA0042997.1 DUF3572 domain-containing protein [Celeribacter litoreus]